MNYAYNCSLKSLENNTFINILKENVTNLELIVSITEVMCKSVDDKGYTASMMPHKCMFIDSFISEYRLHRWLREVQVEMHDTMKSFIVLANLSVN